MSSVNTASAELLNTAIIQSNASNIGRLTDADGRFVRIDWSSPDDQTESLQERNHILSTANPVFEYQIYVWMKPALVISTMDKENRLILVHFLSDTWVYLTDFPPRAVFTVWVRPRTRKGWGIFTKAVFDYPLA
ncbi:unnamed protein product, partial [Dicrocoelium dendriticum]